MKKWIGALMLAFMIGTAQAQDGAIERFFSKYAEDDNFSRVFISPKMMQMAGGFLKSNAEQQQGDEADLGLLMQKIKGIRILNSDKVDGKRLYKEAIGTLNKNKYEDLMDVQDKGQNLKFMIREENGLIAELLMVSGSDKEFTLLSMVGSFTYQDLNMLAEKTNLPGMDAYQSGKTQ